MDDVETEDGAELLERFLDRKKIHRFEGDRGLDNLTVLVEALGYRGHGFKHGSPLEQFLSDNSGACDAIVEFIGTWIDRNSEWRELLEEELAEEE